MQLVEERAPDGFADIGDVITPEEIAEVTETVPQPRPASRWPHSNAARRWSRTLIRYNGEPPARGRAELGCVLGITWHTGHIVGEDATVGPTDRNRADRGDPTTSAGGQRFSGRVAIVTGSTADPSIGRSCALRLAREGASVVINGRDADRVASTESAFRAEGLDVVGVAGSMDTEPAVSLLTDRALEAFGRIDLLVSTVGGAPHPLSVRHHQRRTAPRDVPAQHLADPCAHPCGARPRSRRQPAVRWSPSRVAHRARPPRPWSPTRPPRRR